jgi:hypothetical protein
MRPFFIDRILHCGFVFTYQQFQRARELAIRSYLSSVHKSVEEYHLEHGIYPETLIDLMEMKSLSLDSDMGIPLTGLNYEATATGFSVSYKLMTGRVLLPFQVEQSRIEH